jgi:hypothetical protein
MTSYWTIPDDAGGMGYGPPGTAPIDFEQSHYLPKVSQFYGTKVAMELARADVLVAGGHVFTQKTPVGSGSSGGTAPGTTTPGPTPAATAAVGAPPDVALALLSVPIAQDGMVITAEFHNALRSAVTAIAGYLGEASVNAAVVATLAPTFLEVPGVAKKFEVTLEKAAGVNGANGWMPIDLPDGARLQRLVVLATAAKTLNQLDVTLERVEVNGGPVVVLATASQTSGDGTMKPATGEIKPVGINSPAAVDEMRRVDNSTYRYAIRAKTGGTGGDAAVQVEIHSVQVAFTRW